MQHLPLSSEKQPGEVADGIINIGLAVVDENMFLPSFFSSPEFVPLQSHFIVQKPVLAPLPCLKQPRGRALTQ